MASQGNVSQYDIVRKLARGGMGEVFLARQTGIAGFAKEVVLKRIHQSYAADAQFVRMFLQEARIAAMLDHPNIVQIIELGRRGDNYFIVMEHVRGLSLSRLLKAAAGPLPLPLAIQIAAGVAAGLQFAHDRTDRNGEPMNLVHRDVSPPNVLLSTSGSIKITDFGIAKIRDSVTHTQAGVIKGKFSYISPEQARGEPVDRRADIYSLGLVLYEMTTGVRAYSPGNDKEVLQAVASGTVPAPESHDPAFPSDLRQLLTRALAPDREQRYAECHDLQEDLLALLNTRRIVTSPSKLGQYVMALMEGKAPGLARPEPSPSPSPGWRADLISDAIAEALESDDRPVITLEDVPDERDDAPRPDPAAAGGAGIPARSGEIDDPADMPTPGAAPAAPEPTDLAATSLERPVAAPRGEVAAIPEDPGDPRADADAPELHTDDLDDFDDDAETIMLDRVYHLQGDGDALEPMGPADGALAPPIVAPPANEREAALLEGMVPLPRARGADASRPHAAEPAEPTLPAGAPRRRRRWIVPVLIAIIASLLAAGGILTWLLVGQARAAPSPARVESPAASNQDQ